MASALVAAVAYIIAVIIGSTTKPDDGALLADLIGLATVLLFYATATLTPIFGWLAWRDHRRARGHFSKQERAAQAREASIQAAHANGWEQGCRLAAYLHAGQALPPLVIWGLVLHEGEQAHFDLPVHYARFYGGDGGYQHVSGVFFGNPGFVIAGFAATAVGNAIRRNRARAEAMHCWRGHQLTRVIATNLRLICQVNGTWLSFYFNAATAFYPEPAHYSIVFEFANTSPLRLTGANTPALAVYATWRLHGIEAVARHPALAPLATSAVHAIAIEA